MTRLLLIALAISLCVAGCAKPNADPGVSIPDANTSIGRARVYGDLIGVEAQAVIKHGAGAIKDRGYRISDYADRQRGEHINAESALTRAQADRQALIQQGINKSGEITENKAKADADHQANKWIGWRTRQIFWLIVLTWAGIGIAGVVTGLLGLAGPSAFIMRILPFANVFALIRGFIAFKSGIVLKQAAPMGTVAQPIDSTPA